MIPTETLMIVFCFNYAIVVCVAIELYIQLNNSFCIVATTLSSSIGNRKTGSKGIGSSVNVAGLDFLSQRSEEFHQDTIPAT